jgi:UDPglucose 6-dehydrogenase
MKITIFGSGYVGLVTGACLAEVGHDVLCVDVDEEKVASLKQGKVTIHEPGLDVLIQSNMDAGRIDFTSDPAEGVAHGMFQFIAVGTPPDEDGSADMQYVLAVARTIGSHLNEYKIVVDKSTVPVGTADRVRAELEKALEERGMEGMGFDVVSNPEFLKEGNAIDDFMKPDRIIIGTDNHDAAEHLRALYAPFNRNHDRLIEMDIRSAELTKYAANAMLATKITFMNELANIAEKVGADIERVRIGIGSDQRIGYHFIYPGAGYGGSCFPKDVKALEHTAGQNGYQARLLQAVDQVNEEQKLSLFTKIKRHFAGDLDGKLFALWGLAFKPNTDDMREAPSRVLMEALWAAGARVQAYDPEAYKEARRIYGDREELAICDSAEDALDAADALVIVTEWKQFRAPDFNLVRARLKQPVIFDGRNLYDPDAMDMEGITYYGIGRGASIRQQD